MIRNKTAIFLLLMWSAMATKAQTRFDVDICIYGGTSAGVIAAYAAQKSGKTVVLIEPGRHLGGMSSGGLGYTDIGNKYAITGLARDFYRRIGAHYGKFEQWTFEPKVAESIFYDYIHDGGIQVLYGKQITSVSKDGARITAIVLENSNGSSTELITVGGKIFIDCSYEGDLMAKAGVSYAVGRENNRDYNETINGVQLMDGHQFPDGIDPYKRRGDPASGLVWGVTPNPLEPNGTGDRKIQAYNYRICLTNNPVNRVEITRPTGYDSSRYELVLRLIEANPKKRKLNDYFIWSAMPNQKTDINNRGGFSTDMIGMNYDYPEGDYSRRREIIREHEAYTKGLLYFYGHDPRVPVELRNQMLEWGYPKDEYTDNSNWSPQLYIREARRLIGQYVMTQANCEGKEVVPDGVGMAAYTMDSHNCQRIVINGQVKNEGNVEVGGFGPYPISYGAIIPRVSECTNLLVPVCLSATHIAYGSIRMEPVFMVLAQSSAAAAVMAINNNNTSVQDVNVKALQAELKSNPLSDGRAFDILVDDRDDTVTKTGPWTTESHGGYGPSFLAAEPTDKAISTVTFPATVRVRGRYDCYLYIPKVPGSTSTISVTVNAGKKVELRKIDIAALVVEGQTSGEWVKLGTYELKAGQDASVVVSTTGADGKVVADAVIWTPSR